MEATWTQGKLQGRVSHIKWCDTVFSKVGSNDVCCPTPSSRISPLLHWHLWLPQPMEHDRSNIMWPPRLDHKVPRTLPCLSWDASSGTQSPRCVQSQSSLCRETTWGRQVQVLWHTARMTACVSLRYEWRHLQSHQGAIPYLHQPSSLPGWGPRHRGGEIHYPCWVLSKFLTHRIFKHNKMVALYHSVLQH